MTRSQYFSSIGCRNIRTQEERSHSPNRQRCLMGRIAFMTTEASGELMPMKAERFDTAWLALAGRVLLASIFIVSGLRKIGDMAGVTAYMTGNGIPMAGLLIIPAIVFELGCGLLLAAGLFTRWIALALLAWTCILAVIFHPFWAVDAKAYGLQLNLFLFHLETAGGLVYVFAYGGGRFRVGHRWAGKP
jgi:putative oxidoreductase